MDWGTGMEQGVTVRENRFADAVTGTVAGRARQGVGQPLYSHEHRTVAPMESRTTFGISEYPVAETSKTGDFLIRLSDIIGSVAVLTVALPVMALAAVVIKITSAGPVLYRQVRVGRGGGLFTLYKFRTMIEDAEKHLGPVWASPDDDRVTRVGRVLRRTRIDELPQLYNVLRGDMSLVGPRPERPFFVKQYKALQGVRLAVKPGITGLAQVRNYYDLKPDHKARYDYLYVQKRSLVLNIYILVLTIPVVLAKKGW